MKKLIQKIILISSLFISTISAQVELFNCVTGSNPEDYNGQLGGYALPSEGTIRVFIVFLQFPDDTYDTTNAYWIKGQAPANMNYWVNETWSGNPIQGSLTHYFNNMSFNKLKIIGKKVSVITPHTRQWYLDNNKERGDIHAEVIQQLDQTWDFAQFDLWDLDSVYQHTNQPDGIVEMIMMVWRNIGKDYPENLQDSIYQELNFQNSVASIGSEFTVDNGARTIKSGFWPGLNTPGGSGVTMTDHILQKNIHTPTHEFAHYIMGGNEYHVGYGFWGMLEAWGMKNKVANSFERYRLGWINTIGVDSTPSQTISNATLPDFATTGVSYRLNIDISSNQFFFIENHKNLSYWEQNTPSYNWANNMVFGNVENGIYVLRQDGFVGNNVQIVPADGRFSWIVNQRIENPWGPGLLPVFKNLGSDRVNGYHDLQYIPWVWNGVNQAAAPIHFTENAGQPVLDVRYPGDGKDAFREGHNVVFSPWSNPNSYKANRTSTPFGFKINSLSNGVYSMDIYVNTAINAPPSNPQDCSIAWSGNHPQISWLKNLESDMQSYKIWKYSNGSSIIAATINHNPNLSIQSWIDNDVTKPGKFDPRYEYRYKVKAVDNNNQESLYSNEVAITGYGSQWKINNEEREKIISEYSLNNNYPNPFNPSTLIRYSIKEAGLVSLRVYDVLGKEIAILVNELKPEGIYETEFNGINLPSGVYIYSLRINDFVSNKKMILMK